MRIERDTVRVVVPPLLALAVVTVLVRPMPATALPPAPVAAVPGQAADR